MWEYRTAGRASEVTTEITAIQPNNLPNDRDRALRTGLLGILNTLPVNAGVIVAVRNDDQTEMQIVVKRQPFGSYAT